MKTVYTGGTFDLFHAGHVRFLRQCHLLGENVIVSLNSDEFISHYKGKPPIINFKERREILLACRYVSDVIENIGGADSKPAILEISPDYIVIGTDWAKKNYYKQMGFTQSWLDRHNIVLAYVPYTPGISTTDIKKRLK